MVLLSKPRDREGRANEQDMMLLWVGGRGAKGGTKIDTVSLLFPKNIRGMF